MWRSKSILLHFLIEICVTESCRLLCYVTVCNLQTEIYFHTSYVFIYRCGLYQKTIGATCLFLAWVNFILFIRKVSVFGIYIVMFIYVIKTFFRFFVVFVFLIAAFGFSFCVLLQDQTIVRESISDDTLASGRDANTFRLGMRSLNQKRTILSSLSTLFVYLLNPLLYCIEQCHM